MRTLIAICVLTLFALASPPARAQTEVSGWWRAEIEHNGEREPFYLRLYNDEQGRARARFTIPVVRMHDVFAGPYRMSEDAVELPGLGWRLSVSDDGTALEGVLPHSLVAAGELRARFTRSEAPAPFEAPVPATAPPQPAWTVSMGAAVWAGLALDRRRHRLYVADDSGRVTALSVRNGARAWSVDLGAPIRATPTLDDGRLYVATDAELTALNARSGRRIWSAPFGPERAPRLPISDPHSSWDHYSASAVVEGGVVFAASRDGCVHALAARSGARIWRTCTDVLITSTPALDDDALYVGGFDGIAYKLARADGEIVWRYDTQGPIPRDPLVVDDNVLFGSRSYDLVALDRQSGQRTWTRYFWFSWVDSPPALGDGVVYIGGSDSLAVQALDAANGRRLWSAPLPGWAWGRPAIGGETIYAGAAGGAPYLAPREGGFAAIDRASGALEWLYQPAPAGQDELYGFAAAPVVSGRRVFAADLAGTVYAFDER